MPFSSAPVGWRCRNLSRSPYHVWTEHPGSLTSRLISVSDRFEVELVSSGVSRLTFDERRALGLRRQSFGFVRQVCLRVDGGVVVLARSVVSLQDARNRWNGIKIIGKRPLGEALWRNPKIKRDDLQFAELTPRHALYRYLQDHGQDLPRPLIARRSLFWWGHKPLLVMEAFLPAILKLPCP